MPHPASEALAPERRGRLNAYRLKYPLSSSPSILLRLLLRASLRLRLRGPIPPRFAVQSPFPTPSLPSSLSYPLPCHLLSLSRTPFPALFTLTYLAPCPAFFFVPFPVSFQIPSSSSFLSPSSFHLSSCSPLLLKLPLVKQKASSHFWFIVNPRTARTPTPRPLTLSCAPLLIPITYWYTTYI